MKKGFTLIELLITMAIMGILATLIVGGFQSAQLRGRDAQRKSDLKELVNSLELFYNDYGFYPADSSGQIAGCPYVSGGTSTACAWGTAQFSDTRTVYFKKLPADPLGAQSYFYRIVPGSGNKKFQIFARIENTQDRAIITGLTYSCGTVSKTCNFAITSANTSPTE